MVISVAAGCAVAGLAAGAGARVLLSRLRRGAELRPPGCELATAASWALTGWLYAAGWVPLGWLPALLGLGWLAVAASAVDLTHRRLPDALTLPALPAALLAVAPLGGEAVLRAGAGAGLLAAAHAAVHLAAPGALGAGDVKLAGPVGAVLAAASWAALPWWAALAAVLTLLAAILHRPVRRLYRPPREPPGLPHGVAMLAVGWLVTVGSAITGCLG